MQYVLEVLQAGDEWDYGHVAVAHVDHTKLAGRVQTPTLVLCGQRDMIWPECYECASLFPNAESQIIDGGGVDVFEQFPAELAARMDEFFRRA
jgi:pimeloyl-ACP methyl ester carboxylesterase